jgi:hypothetical protein
MRPIPKEPKAIPTEFANPCRRLRPLPFGGWKESNSSELAPKMVARTSLSLCPLDFRVEAPMMYQAGRAIATMAARHPA